MNTEGTGPVPNPSLGLDNPATWSTILGDKQRFVHVTCNAVPGVYLLDDQAVVCGCAACTAAGKPSGEHLISPTEFERHAGLGATRKWRHSIKVTAGQPGRCEGAAVISIGWVRMAGMDSLTCHEVFVTAVCLACALCVCVCHHLSTHPALPSHSCYAAVMFQPTMHATSQAPTKPLICCRITHIQEVAG